MATKLKAPKVRKKPKLTAYQSTLIARILASDPPIVCASRGASGAIHYSIGNGGAATKRSVSRLIARAILLSNGDGLIADDPQSYRVNIDAINEYIQQQQAA